MMNTATRLHTSLNSAAGYDGEGDERERDSRAVRAMIFSFVLGQRGVKGDRQHDNDNHKQT